MHNQQQEQQQQRQHAQASNEHHAAQQQQQQLQSRELSQELMLDDLNLLIVDHLTKMGFNQSAADMHAELQERMSQKLNNNAKALLNTLSSSFDRGQKNKFFEAWQMLIPQDMLRGDFITKKLEFYLHLYFVVYIFHPYNNQNFRPRTEQELKTEQMDFKNYLDSRGAELSKTSEFLAFYALPYIQNPMEHPSFQSLYTIEWVNTLKSKLKAFIHERAFELGLPHLAQQPSGLYMMYSQQSQGGGPQPSQAVHQNDEMSDRLSQMQKTLVTYQRKEQYAKKALYDSQIKWTQFSSDIVRLCKELIDALESENITQYSLKTAAAAGPDGVQASLAQAQNNPGSSQSGKRPTRMVAMVKDKILKYDSFLQKNRTELNSKEFQQSLGWNASSGISSNQVASAQQVQQHPSQDQGRNTQNQQQPGLPSFSDQSSIKRQEETLSNHADALFSQRDQRAQGNTQGGQQPFQPGGGHQQQQYALPLDNDHPDSQGQRDLLSGQGQDGLVAVPGKKLGVSLVPLDFAKLKDFFRDQHSNETHVCVTLQALRWRLTRVSTSMRRQILTSFVHFDVLEIDGSGSDGKEGRVFEVLFYSQSLKVKEYLVAFLNSLANEYQGRSYLLKYTNIVAMLIEALYAEGNEDSYLRQNTLGTLQKFSLRKGAQTSMIEGGVIGWIVQILKGNQDYLSDYSMEYATALLMNLSLRNRGKDECEKLSPQINILKILSDMMEHDNLQVRTHVNGTLYSILTRPNLKQQANALGMIDMLAYLMKSSDEQMQRQVQYIYNQLCNADQPNQEGEDGGDPTRLLDEKSDIEEEEEEDYEEDIEEMDDDEDEIDHIDETELFDTLKIEGVLTGEEWLTKQFLLANTEAMAQTVTISKKIEEENKEKLNKSDISNNRRPVSPFGTGPGDNPFSLSKVGYANPANLDRSLPSAMKTRNKIPRTPDGVEVDPNWKDEFIPDRPFSLEEYIINNQGVPQDNQINEIALRQGQPGGHTVPQDQADRLAELHNRILDQQQFQQQQAQRQGGVGPGMNTSQVTHQKRGIQSHQSSGNQVSSLGQAAAQAQMQPQMSTEQMKYLPQQRNGGGGQAQGALHDESQAFAARDLIPRTPYINR